MSTTLKNGHCATCRWWGDGGDSVGGYGFYVLQQNGWGICGLSLEDTDISMIQADAADDYGACVVTAPNFGCVQWEVAL